MEKEQIQKPKQVKIASVVFVFLALALFFQVSMSPVVAFNNKKVASKSYTLKILKTSTAISPDKIKSSAKFTKLDNGFFNLSSSPYAVVSIQCIQLCSARGKNWISVSRNNHFSPIYLTYINENERVKQSLLKATSDSKLMRMQLPEMNHLQEIFIELSGRYLRGQIIISGEENIFDNIKTASVMSGMYYGVVLLFILFSLVLATLKQPVTYFSYALMLLITALWIASGEGWLNFLIPSLAQLPFFTANSLGILFFLSFASFSKQYLQLKVLHKVLSRFLSFSQVYMTAVWLFYCVFFERLPTGLYQAFYAVTLLVGLAILLSSLTGAVVSFRKGRQQAIFYLLAASVFFGVGLTSALSISAVIEGYMGWHSIQLASFLEILLLTMGFIVWHQQQTEEVKQLDSELRNALSELTSTKLDIEKLKSNMTNNLIPPTLTPHIARLVSLLPNCIYIKACGNYSEAHYKQSEQIKMSLIDCNLQAIEESLGHERVFRCHKSYLVLVDRYYEVKRRSSADFDLFFDEVRIPIGRKYLNKAKLQFEKNS